MRGNFSKPCLGIRFDTSKEELRIYRPNGEAFATYLEIQRQLEQAQAFVQQAEQRLQEMEDLLRKYRERFGDLPE